jgi:hypothetical protein
MQLANQEAQRFNHEYIGTEHVLLGLVKEGSGVAANVLKRLDVDLRKIRLEVEKIVRPGPDMFTMGKLPQTSRAKKVIEYAMEEARNLNCNYVGTEHLLLGLLREQEGIAAQVLMNLGLKLEDVREKTFELLVGPVEQAKAELPQEPFQISTEEVGDVQVHGPELVASLRERIEHCEKCVIFTNDALSKQCKLVGSLERQLKITTADRDNVNRITKSIEVILDSIDPAWSTPDGKTTVGEMAANSIKKLADEVLVLRELPRQISRLQADLTIGGAIRKELNELIDSIQDAFDSFSPGWRMNDPLIPAPVGELMAQAIRRMGNEISDLRKKLKKRKKAKCR